MSFLTLSKMTLSKMTNNIMKTEYKNGGLQYTVLRGVVYALRIYGLRSKFFTIRT